MAGGWSRDGAVQEQIEASIEEVVTAARRKLADGPGLSHCGECEASIPEARRKAVPGVRLCVACQSALDNTDDNFSAINRRGSKDSQLR